ncbi:MAG: ATP-binding cassette domain-containing protein [Spirochaetales bacterium]
MSRKIRPAAIVQYAVGLLLFFAVWWGGSLLAGPSVLPPPSRVLVYLADSSVLLDFLLEVARTIGRGLLGFSVAWIVAIPAGLLMGRRRSRERVGFFPLILLQSAPPLFWIMPLILWIGTDGFVASVVAFLISLPLLTTHVTAAIRHIPEYAFDVFWIYAPYPSVIARELYVPRLIPAVRSNVQLGFLLSVKGAMLAEWFAAQNGFGRRIQVFYQFFSLTEFVGWAFLFLLVVGALSLGTRRLLERALPEYRRTREMRSVAASGVARNKGGVVIPGGPTTGRALEVRNLSFGYGSGGYGPGAVLFRGLSFSVSSDTPLVLYGRSGCGKTTLLKLLAGLLKPWSGTVDTPGRPALLFQEDALLEHRDAIGNVLLPSLRRFGEEEVMRARAALALWGLSGHEARFPHELSGGMRKRLSMARAWYHEPRMLLLDEPFVNLDKEAREALWETFFSRVSGTSIPTIIVTHYPEELERYRVRLTAWERLTGDA